jgi:hypothetical protein
MELMVSGALAILPVPGIGTWRMAKEYCLAFSARPTKKEIAIAHCAVDPFVIQRLDEVDVLGDTGRT